MQIFLYSCHEGSVSLTDMQAYSSFKLRVFIFFYSGSIEKGPGVKRLSSLDDKIPPKSPRPRRNIWLSRSQSDIFSRKPSRKINVQDPYYTPNKGLGRKVNPFSAREDLKGGKIKFFDMPSKSVISLVFDLHSPEAGGGLKASQSQFRQAYSADWQEFSLLPGRRCRSLPLSPELPHKEYGLFGGLSSTVGRCDPTQLGAEVRQKLLSSSKYGVSEIPPFQAKPHRPEFLPAPGQEEDMDCSDGPVAQEENGFCPVENTCGDPACNQPLVLAQPEPLSYKKLPVENSVNSEGHGSSQVFVGCLPSEEMEVEDDLLKNIPLESTKPLFSVSPSTELKREAWSFREQDGDSPAPLSQTSSNISASGSTQSTCDIWREGSNWMCPCGNSCSQSLKLCFSIVLGFTFGRDSADGRNWLSDRQLQTASGETDYFNFISNCAYSFPWFALGGGITPARMAMWAPQSFQEAAARAGTM